MNGFGAFRIIDVTSHMLVSSSSCRQLRGQINWVLRKLDWVYDGRLCKLANCCLGIFRCDKAVKSN